MNWYSVALAAVSGGIGAGVATLLFGKKTENKTAFNAAAVVVFILLMTVSHVFILPKLNARKAKDDALAGLRAVPAFASIEKYSPDTYRAITKSITDTIDNGGTAQQATAQVRGQVLTFVGSRLPNASDEALVKYIVVMSAEIAELQSRPDAACHQFLFPQGGAGIDIAKMVSKATQDKDLAALDEVIKTSSTKRPVPSQGEVMPHLRPVMLALSQKYGTGLSVLDNPTAPGVDKAKVCSVTHDLYQNIVALPPAAAATTLRFLFGQK